MGWPQFLAWAATQGFKNIKVLRQAYNSFKKFPGKDAILKKAKNLWDDVIKKTPTKDLADKVRQGMKVKPKIVKNKWTDKHGQTWMRDEKGNPIQITEGLGKYKWWKAQADAKRKIISKPESTLPKILKDRPNKPTGPHGTRTWKDKTGKIIEEKVIPTPKKLIQKTTIDDLQIGPHIDSRGRLWPKFVKIKPKGPAKIIKFPKPFKKPKGRTQEIMDDIKKIEDPEDFAQGGSIDKALPKRSRDI